MTDVVIPRVAMEFDADPQRVAIGEISMGGYGAFDVERVNPRRFCAVGGHSPALSQTASETAPGAFDDAEDFAAHDVIGAAESAPERYLSEPIWSMRATRTRSSPRSRLSPRRSRPPAPS